MTQVNWVIKKLSALSIDKEGQTEANDRGQSMPGVLRTVNDTCDFNVYRAEVTQDQNFPPDTQFVSSRRCPSLPLRARTPPCQPPEPPPTSSCQVRPPPVDCPPPILCGQL